MCTSRGAALPCLASWRKWIVAVRVLSSNSAVNSVNYYFRFLIDSNFSCSQASRFLRVGNRGCP
mgnify:CR=1 FL=1